MSENYNCWPLGCACCCVPLDLRNSSKSAWHRMLRCGVRKPVSVTTSSSLHTRTRQSARAGRICRKKKIAAYSSLGTLPVMILGPGSASTGLICPVAGPAAPARAHGAAVKTLPGMERPRYETARTLVPTCHAAHVDVALRCVAAGELPNFLIVNAPCSNAAFLCISVVLFSFGT